jgi:hypothetical protein
MGGLVLLAGCDMGLEQSANRYEQLNIETKKLIDVLRQVTDEASAKAHQSEIEDLGEKIREIQERIAAAEEKKAKEGGNMGTFTNYRQASMFEQTGDNARRQLERIRESDAKAGAIVDAALQGIAWPEPLEAGG